ncbi:MAG: arginyltransferase [Gammaproteobacteria bacterium RIFCSPLOWO2_02_FULL_56_15]|nr:MAG: arginyltransferase [Gammaproteobacteria bacterium RIFCSPLOWO2_02_FULL_56_15]
MTMSRKLAFYATPPHVCNYLPGQEAVTLFADPQFPKNPRVYAALADCGFRRSGEHLYVPHCHTCHQCIPVRVPVARFSASENQERTLRRNRGLAIHRLPAEFNDEHFALYRRYINSRHSGGGMDNPSEKTYMEFLTSSWSQTWFYEMRLDERLVCVAVADFMVNAMSAVYTFFDTGFARYSPGKFAILHEISEARRLGFDWLYLGYWIRNCNKMTYKTDYQPLEYFYNNGWHPEPPLATDNTLRHQTG